MNARETGRRSAFALMLCMLIGGIAAAGGDG